jgi:hypothetical protein
MPVVNALAGFVAIVMVGFQYAPIRSRRLWFPIERAIGERFEAAAARSAIWMGRWG